MSLFIGVFLINNCGAALSTSNVWWVSFTTYWDSISACSSSSIGFFQNLTFVKSVVDPKSFHVLLLGISICSIFFVSIKHNVSSAVLSGFMLPDSSIVS